MRGKIFSSALLIILAFTFSVEASITQWEETFGNGLIQTRIYDDRGLPSDDNLGTINLRHNSFDAKGNLTSKTDGAGQIDYSYDAIDQIKTESVSSVNSYQYDANGNRLNKSGVGYTYELASNRLTGKGGQAVITDPAGQITATGNFTLLYTGAGQIDHIDQQGAELVRYQ